MLVVAQRFCGPPASGNGGYSSGLTAAALGTDGPVEVTLRTPPPLDTELEAVRTPGGVEVRHGEVLVAEARHAELDLEPPAPPTFEEAEKAAARFPWWHDHPYPTCFVCGPSRAEGDGLRIFPGALSDRPIAAAPWVPDPSVAIGDDVRREVVWAALDCPSWFGFACFESWEGRPLLGRITAEVRALPRVGGRYVASGWHLGTDGRKIAVASMLSDDRGEVLGLARATWLTVPA